MARLLAETDYNRRGRKCLFIGQEVWSCYSTSPQLPKIPKFRVYFMQIAHVNMINVVSQEWLFIGQWKQITTPLPGFHMDNRGASRVTDSELAALFLLCVKWERDASSCICVGRELGTLNQCSSTADVAQTVNSSVCVFATETSRFLVITDCSWWRLGSYSSSNTLFFSLLWNLYDSPPTTPLLSAPSRSPPPPPPSLCYWAINHKFPSCASLSLSLSFFSSYNSSDFTSRPVPLVCACISYPQLFLWPWSPPTPPTHLLLHRRVCPMPFLHTHTWNTWHTLACARTGSGTLSAAPRSNVAFSLCTSADIQSLIKSLSRGAVNAKAANLFNKDFGELRDIFLRRICSRSFKENKGSHSTRRHFHSTTPPSNGSPVCLPPARSDSEPPCVFDTLCLKKRPKESCSTCTGRFIWRRGCAIAPTSRPTIPMQGHYSPWWKNNMYPNDWTLIGAVWKAQGARN